MATSLASASATFLKGFSFAPYNPDGSCKNSSDWMQAFNYTAALPGNFTSARLTATSECSALANAVPSALHYNISLLVGVVAEPDDVYNAEKVALTSTLKEHEKDGFDWLMGVNVGLEDEVFNSANISHLVAQIFDVRGMIEDSVPAAKSTLVGHVDSLQGWNGSTDVSGVINACDFLGLDFDPYLENGNTETSNATFWSAVNTMWTIGQNKPVWVTQSAWPVTGLANAGREIAQTYYDETWCRASTEVNIFMNHLRDYNSTPSYGVYNQTWGMIYDMDCPSFSEAASSATANNPLSTSNSTLDTNISPATTMTGTPTNTTSTPDFALSASAGSYTVQLSNNLWEIANSHGISLSQLEAANPTIVPESISPGQVITIPAQLSTAQAPPPPTSAPSSLSSAPSLTPSTVSNTMAGTSIAYGNRRG